MKSLIVKLLGLQILGAVATVFVLVLLLNPIIVRDQTAQSRERGQALAGSLVHTWESVHGHVHSASLQSAMADAEGRPGVAWVCILTGDGRIVEVPAGTVSKTLGRRLRATALASFAMVMPETRQAVTVFRLASSHGTGGVVYVGMGDDFLRQCVLHVERTDALWLTAAWAGISVLLVLCLRRSLSSLRRVIQALRDFRGEGDEALTVAGAETSSEMHTLIMSVNRLFAQMRRREQDVRLAEVKFRGVVEDAVIGFWQTTPEGRFLSANTAMARLYGYETVEELMRESADPNRQVYVDPDHRARALQRMLEKGVLRDCESQIKQQDGRVIWIVETARPVKDAQGRLAYFEGTAEDITPRKRAEAERAHLAHHLHLLLESSGEGIYGVDLQGNCTFLNKAGAQMLGYTTSELLGRNIHTAIHHSHADRTGYPEDRGYVYNCMRTGKTSRVDDEVLWRKDRTKFQVEYTAAPLIEGGQLAGAVVTFVDITSRKAVEAEQKRLLAEAIERADHDPLTGLLNHRAFQRRLEEEADRAQRGGSLLAIALLDIDNFKFFNDVYGHKVGDEVLQKVASALRTSSRSYDSLSRFGGDEFAILMPCKGDETAADMAAQLRQRLAGVSYRPEGYDQAIPLGLSVGLALFPSEGAGRNDVLEIADERLRRAKTGGDDDGYAEMVRANLNRSQEGFSMLDALVTAVDNKDRYTRKHSEDVMRYCVEIADALGLDAQMRRRLETAALIHDVGKIGVPDHILRKPGQLSDEEFAAIKQHPTMGAVIAEAVSGFEETLPAIRYHHERWDGKGYPEGLHGSETPFIARIMSVADAFSAMTTDRPYRKGMPQVKALAILESGAGIQWDAQCVHAFLTSRRAADKIAVTS